MLTNAREDLLHAAEQRIRAHGFHGVSFRDLAGDLGIKSASVHYHFPKKEDLGVAVVEGYSARFFDDLDARVAAGEDAVAAFVDKYRQTLTGSDEQGLSGCLCGVMGAETLGLPDPVRGVVRVFLKDNIRWLAGVLATRDVNEPELQAIEVVAGIQGAMMLAVNLGDVAVFEVAAISFEKRF